MASRRSVEHGPADRVPDLGEPAREVHHDQQQADARGEQRDQLVVGEQCRQPDHPQRPDHRADQRADAADHHHPDERERVARPGSSAHRTARSARARPAARRRSPRSRRPWRSRPAWCEPATIVQAAAASGLSRAAIVERPTPLWRSRATTRKITHQRRHAQVVVRALVVEIDPEQRPAPERHRVGVAVAEHRPLVDELLGGDREHEGGDRQPQAAHAQRRRARSPRRSRSPRRPRRGSPAGTASTSRGRRRRRSGRPSPAKVICASDSWPAHPVITVSERAQIAKQAMLANTSWRLGPRDHQRQAAPRSPATIAAHGRRAAGGPTRSGASPPAGAAPWGRRRTVHRRSWCGSGRRPRPARSRTRRSRPVPAG